jgi:hypothetical protein
LIAVKSNSISPVVPAERRPKPPPRSGENVGRGAEKLNLQTLGRLMGEHPASVLSLAFAVGVFLGWLVKRT